MANKRQKNAAKDRFPILGFRSNKWWKKTIALIYYIPMLLLMIAAILTFNREGAGTVFILSAIALAFPLYIGSRRWRTAKKSAIVPEPSADTSELTNSVIPEQLKKGEKNNAMGYTDVILHGKPEKKEAIPLGGADNSPESGTPLRPTFTVTITSRNPAAEDFRFDLNSSQSRMSYYDRFMEEMKTYADKSGPAVSFVPFMSYYPTYAHMDERQQAWYFYWRSQVRNGSYPDTDLSYIFVHIYELINGCGWANAEDGYAQLMTLWKAYRDRLPNLDFYLCGWTFDFAYLHGLKYDFPEFSDLRLPSDPTILNAWIDQHSEEHPLKLPFALIDALCDYSLVGSKFYKDGHQLLMQEAIPRVLALADAALVKQKGRGILAAYGPSRPRKQTLYIYQGANYSNSNRQVDLSVKAYTTSQKLRGYINELVRYTENALRSLYGYRGRLRGITLDEDAAKLVDAFLKREYDPARSRTSTIQQTNAFTLDFDSIRALRAESDAVREALAVPEEDTEKPLLTDLQAVTDLLQELSPEAIALFNDLHEGGWECACTSSMSNQMEEINRFATQYLARALLVQEHELLIVEDDYRDELDHIWANRSEPIVPKDNALAEKDTYFDTTVLSPEMCQLFESLTAAQRQSVHAILTQEDPQSALERIAEEELSMPEILIDEINDTAAQILDDILIDTLGGIPCVLEQYEAELKQALRQEENP